MRNQKIHEILQNVIALSNERDSNALELALAQTLFKFAALEHVHLYRVSSIDLSNDESSLTSEHFDTQEAIPIGLLDDLRTCLDTVSVVEITFENKQLSLFPLLSTKNKPIAVIAFETDAELHEYEVLLLVLKLYNNFVTLMNENERDTLTGLLNRKTFDHHISSIIAQQNPRHHKRTDDHHGTFYLAIFDVDHFKQVNDHFGHLIGDEVLLLFSRIMTQSFRQTDVLYRFGGEEFIGVFQCPDDDTMKTVLNRLRFAVECHQFPQVDHITVSCGFTRIQAFDIASNLIDRADVALYYAKRHGRNQVCQHETLVNAGLLDQSKPSGEIELFYGSTE